MTLYILSASLFLIGLSLSIHQHKDAYRDTWAFILMGIGLLMALIKTVIDLGWFK